jgi:hypothetical protein
MLRKLLAVGISQRSASYILKIHRITVARKLVFLGIRARLKILERNKKYLFHPLAKVHFDEMESFEHTKMKPLSIPLAVCAQTREVLDFQVCPIPAKGLLAERSRRKYGKRPDGRKEALRRLFENIHPFLQEDAEILSDKNTLYPLVLKKIEQNWVHKTTKGRRGSLVGGGELKVGGFDPLFSLNHTCAMFRAHINRLFRRTWNTTKKPERLAHHLAIYIDFHNQRIVEKRAKKATRKAKNSVA